MHTSHLDDSFFLLLLSLISLSTTQTITNPAANTIIHCGLQEHCNIYCIAFGSCKSSTFYLYNNSTYVECRGEQSCQSLKIISINATDIQFDIIGDQGFKNGIAFFKQFNKHIITNCNGEQSCQDASFYYDGIGLTVDHHCNNSFSCERVLISAIIVNNIHLNCDNYGNEEYACNDIDIHFPINTEYISTIHMHNIVHNMYIYSMNGLSNLNISYSGNIQSYSVYIIHGIQYQHICPMYDNICMSSLDIHTAVTDNTDLQFIYYSENDVNTNLHQLDHDNLILFIPILETDILTNSSSITSIATTQPSNFIHIICIDNLYHPSCTNIDFNLSVTNDAIITANNANSINIIGPINKFKRISFRDGNDYNQYYLENTRNIIIQCSQLNGGECLKNSVLETGLAINVTVECGTTDCHQSDIYSDIDISSLSLTLSSLGDLGFNVICKTNQVTSCDDQFYLNFVDDNETITCNTPDDINCIGFLSKSPTISPTYDPTTIPTVIPTIIPTNEPTMKPTLYPTFSPSIFPSMYPSIAPLLYPSMHPSISPSNVPTYHPILLPSASPTRSPTYIPSIAPTSIPVTPPTRNPTLAPSISPSMSPTTIPTAPPTSAPTYSPTLTPTNAPTNVPTGTPTTPPTKTPTGIPTIPPTAGPTYSPSLTPTNGPTQPPSNAPTAVPSTSPTEAPTRYPVKDGWYTFKVQIPYIIAHLTEKNVASFDENNILNTTIDLQYLFEYCYLTVSKQFRDDENDILHYRLFEVIISHHQTNYLNHSDVVNLLCDIHYRNDSVGTTIRWISSKEVFRNFTQIELQTYYSNHALRLSVDAPLDEDIIDGKQSTESQYVFIVTILFFCIAFMIAIASFIYNSFGMQKSWTDNGNSLAFPLYTLQVVDLLSDINLMVEMFIVLTWEAGIEHRNLLLIATIGALIFTVVPYVTNIALAANIRNYKLISKNPFAKSYFQTTSWLFIVFVVFSGGVYASVSLVSSRLFAFEILNSGLTQFELTKLTKIRLFLNIMLENIPQLICQMLYIQYLGKPTSNTILALILSLLQIIAAVTNYFVTHRSSDCHVIQYDLEMKIQQSINNHKSGSDANETAINPNELEFLEGKPHKESTPESQRMSHLNIRQKKRIRKRKEHKAALRRAICTQLLLPLNKIELGYITLTPNGLIIHCIHYTFENERKKFDTTSRFLVETKKYKKDVELEEIVELNQKSDPSKENKVEEIMTFDYSARLYVKALYKTNIDGINQAFARHFGFNQHNVTVIYHKKYKYSPLGIQNRKNFSYTNVTQIDTDDDNDDDGGVTMTISNSDLLASMSRIKLITMQINAELHNGKDPNEIIDDLLAKGVESIIIQNILGLGAKVARTHSKLSNTDDYDNGTGNDSDGNDQNKDKKKDNQEKKEEESSTHSPVSAFEITNICPVTPVINSEPQAASKSNVNTGEKECAIDKKQNNNDIVVKTDNVDNADKNDTMDNVDNVDNVNNANNIDSDHVDNTDKKDKIDKIDNDKINKTSNSVKLKKIKIPSNSNVSSKSNNTAVVTNNDKKK